MALPYIGNNDYRGYLNYQAQGGDSNAAALLDLVGNDGNFSNGEQFMAPYSVGINNANAAYWAEWNGQGDTGGSTGGSTSGGTGTNAVLNDAAIDNTQKAVQSLGTEFATGVDNINDNYGSLIGQYDTERTRTEGDYNEQGVTNNQNLLKNKQNALLAAAQGRRGLRGTLASLGALSGTGGELADRAVTTAANQDIGGATDAFATNAQSLDKAWDRFDEEDDERRREAGTAKSNQRTALEGTIAGKRQTFYEKLAELFAEGGDTGSATEWLNKAGDLNEVIASKSRVAATPFSRGTAAFTPGDLKSYLAGAGDMTVDVQGGGPGMGGPTSILAGRSNRESDDERRRKLALA